MKSFVCQNRFPLESLSSRSSANKLRRFGPIGEAISSEVKNALNPWFPALIAVNIARR